MTAKSIANETARRALSGIPSTTVLDVVDRLDLRPSPATPAVLLVPLRSLKQRRDVPAFVRSAPLMTTSFLLEVLGHEVLDAIIEHLGDSASDPTLEELTNAVDAVLASGADPALVRGVLAHVVAENFPAAPHCLALLETKSELALPELA